MTAKNAAVAVEKKLPAVQELKIEGTSALVLMDHMEKLIKVGQFMVSSGLMPSTVKSAANAALIIWTGHELGLKPMQSIQFINVISGKPTLAPVMMRALIIGSGAEEAWEITENTATVCTIRAKRKDGQDYTRSFTLEEASKIMSTEFDAQGAKKTVPLTQKFNWKNMPATMLLWRCTSAVCRVVYPDVINGMYIPDEMEDASVAYDIEIIAAEVAEQAASPDGKIIEVEVPTAAGRAAETEGSAGEVCLTPDHLKDIRARLTATSSDEAKFCAAINVASLVSVPDSWHPELVGMLEKKALKLAEATPVQPAEAAKPAEPEKPAPAPAAPEKPAAAAPAAESEDKPVQDVIEFLTGANINYTMEGNVINCGKSFKHKPALTSLGFTWDGDRQGFVYKAAA